MIYSLVSGFICFVCGIFVGLDISVRNYNKGVEDGMESMYSATLEVLKELQNVERGVENGKID